jgi:hypothetical protein
MSKKKNSSPKIITYIIWVISLLGSFVLGILFRTLYPVSLPVITQLRESGYEYINPLIDFEVVSAV